MKWNCRWPELKNVHKLADYRKELKARDELITLFKVSQLVEQVLEQVTLSQGTGASDKGHRSVSLPIRTQVRLLRWATRLFVLAYYHLCKFLLAKKPKMTGTDLIEIWRSTMN